MSARFTPLRPYPVAHGAAVMRRADVAEQRVTEDSTALDVMTDLAVIDAVRVSSNVPVDAALEQMKSSGVRLLFVTGAGDELLGVITSRDIEGEKPMRFQRETGLTRADVLVRDIMTARESLEALKLDDVRHARAGDIVATLKNMGRQHAIVVDAAGGRMRVCGLFSTTRISRQLGVVMEVAETARTFSEIEAALR